MNKYRPITFLKWLLIVFLLGYMALIMTFSENSIDQALKPLCPEGFWHTGLNWRHCAYPPISIAKYTSMYLGYSIFALLVVHFLAPQYKFFVTCGLLLTLIAIPSYSLLFNKFSWVASFSLIGAVILTLAYVVYYKVTHNLSFKRDAAQKRVAP